MNMILFHAPNALANVRVNLEYQMVLYVPHTDVLCLRVLNHFDAFVFYLKGIFEGALLGAECTIFPT